MISGAHSVHNKSGSPCPALVSVVWARHWRRGLRPRVHGGGAAPHTAFPCTPAIAPPAATEQSSLSQSRGHVISLWSAAKSMFIKSLESLQFRLTVTVLHACSTSDHRSARSVARALQNQPFSRMSHNGPALTLWATDSHGLTRIGSGSSVSSVALIGSVSSVSSVALISRVRGARHTTRVQSAQCGPVRC